MNKGNPSKSHQGGRGVKKVKPQDFQMLVNNPMGRFVPCQDSNPACSDM